MRYDVYVYVVRRQRVKQNMKDPIIINKASKFFHKSYEVRSAYLVWYLTNYVPGNYFNYCSNYSHETALVFLRLINS